jgi:arylsulfatase A-like enzyme
MDNHEENRDGPKLKAKSRALVYALIVVLTVIAVIIAFSVGIPELFFGESPELPESSFGYLRRPIKEKSFAYQTMLAEQRPDSPRWQFPVSAQSEDLVEFGLIRIDSTFGEPCDYTFTVYARTAAGRKKIFETSGRFPLNSWELFRAKYPLPPVKLSQGKVELEYSLKPKGWREQLDAIFARAMGRPYWKDFAFIAPTVIQKRQTAELNVILVVLDTLRADRLGCLGYPKPTSPNIDAFARENILFTHAVSPSPWTLPAHFSLLTGLYPSAQLDNGSGWEMRSYAEKSMADLLKARGYSTVAIGSLAHASGFGKGFDVFRKFNYTKDAKKSFVTKKIFDDAMTWIAENRESKFFMLLHNYECHIPYEGTAFLEEGQGAGFAATRNSLYDGDVKSIDAFFGQLVERLESLDLLSNTIVIVTSDHGEHFYDHFAEEDRVPPGADLVPEMSHLDHGHSVYEELTRVPIIFHLPGFRPAKSVFENRARLTDVLPTILDFLDIDHDGPMQGESLIGLMLEGERPTEPPAVSEFTFSGPEQKSIILHGYKYIYAGNPDEKKGGVGYRNIPVHALYNLETDPGEKNNIYDENTELAMQFHQQLEMVIQESRSINARLQTRQSEKGTESAGLPQDVIDSLDALGYLKN